MEETVANDMVDKGGGERGVRTIGEELGEPVWQEVSVVLGFFCLRLLLLDTLGT